MRFSSRAECEALFGRLGVGRRGPIAGTWAARLKAFIGYYKSPLPTAAQVGKALARSQGDFLLCCLWADDILGDSRETPAHRRYRRWRSACGEKGPLCDAPGHMFEAGEGDLLAEVAEMALDV